MEKGKPPDGMRSFYFEYDKVEHIPKATQRKTRDEIQYTNGSLWYAMAKREH